ncbi:MAG: flagellar motor switch protein FliN, partial [Actinomycetes bacterium]
WGGGARLTGLVDGEMLVVVSAELGQSLASSPLGPLDLASAVTPALVAAAGALGAVTLEPARNVEPELAVDSLRGKEICVGVPLVAADGTVQAYFASAAALRGGVATTGARPAGHRPGLDLLHDVELEVSAELGRTRMTVRELLGLAPGAVVELDRAAASPIDLLVNGTLLARGEVVVIDEEFGLRITEIVSGTTVGSDGGSR